MAEVDLFYEFAARAFDALWKAFPRKISLDARQLSNQTRMDDLGTVLDEAGQPSIRFEIARASIEWLAETGLIRGSRCGPWGLPDAVLTPVGKMALEFSPPMSRETETIGETVERALRDGSLDSAKGAAQTAINTAFEIMKCKGIEPCTCYRGMNDMAEGKSLGQ